MGLNMGLGRGTGEVHRAELKHSPGPVERLGISPSVILEGSQTSY